MYNIIMMEQDAGALLAASEVETIDEALAMLHRVSMSDRIAYWCVLLDDKDEVRDVWFLPMLRLTDEVQEQRKDLAVRFVRVLRGDRAAAERR